MSQEQESSHIKFEGAVGNEVVIRHGQAEPIHTPGTLKLSGNFKAPAESIAKRRTVDTDNTAFTDGYFDSDIHVIFSEKELSITLVVGENDREEITVTGSLKKNPFLNSLKINGQGHTNKDLLNLIRFKPHFFANREDHKSLVIGLQNFEVKTDTEHKASNDRQGTVENRQFTRAQSSLSGKSIVLNVPFFEGHESAAIHLTIEVEPNNGSVLLFLVSETFEEFWDMAVQAQFDAQRPVFEPFVIIEK